MSDVKSINFHYMVSSELENLYHFVCPVCHFEWAHCGHPRVEDSEDNYKAGWWGRGDLIVIPFWGECGGEWEVCIGYHKGMSFAVTRITKDCQAKIDYHEYIQSEAWREKATAAKERAGWRCQICNAHKDEVTLDAHHRTYERLGNELPEDITVLCRVCHSIYEQNKKSKAAKNGQVKK